MSEYRKVFDFSYNNNLYTMFLDDYNKHYFLKIIDGKYCYVTMDELIPLSLFLNDIPDIMYVENKTKKYRIMPKVIVGGVAVSLSLLTLSSGIAVYESNKRVELFEKEYRNENPDIKNYLSYETDEEKKKDY